MWRWTALVIVAVLHKQISSQPITENSNNDWPTTHLDLEESCSCEDLEKSTIRRDARYDDQIDAGSEDRVFTRMRDLDDCPCRFRDTDSQGASSLLFPTAMRSAGTYLRPGAKKEVKPLFNPEVDLASSVLEQLRVATDEEYQEALARDAAKSTARAVEDIVFGDATPQESANIVTIVVNSKATDSDDVIPQASNIKQSRCIHPLQRASSLSFSDRSRLSKKRSYDRNLQGIDSEVGASTIDEQILSLDDKKITSPLAIKETKNTESFTRNNDIDDNCNVPDFRSTFVQKKLKNLDLASSPLLQSIKDRFRPLSRVPKLKLESQLPEDSKTNYDLSPASSIVHEQATKKVPYLRNNSKLETIKQQSRPLSITNLLNLKDVELIPLKDLISKQAKKSKYLKSGLLPSMSEQDDGEFSIENGNKDTENWKTTRLTLRSDPMKNSISEPKSSSSDVNFEVTPMSTSINSDNCNNEKELKELNRESPRNYFIKPKEVLPSILEYDNGKFSTENVYQDSDSGTIRFTEVNDSVIDNIGDAESSPSLLNVQIAPKELQMIKDSCDSAGVTKDADVENGPKSTEILDTIPVFKDDVPKVTFDSQNDCVEDNNHQHSITDASNNISNTIDQLETQSSENVESDYSKPKSMERDDNSKTIKEPRLKLLDSNSIDKFKFNIKSYILKQKEDLNHIKTSIKNRNIPNQESEYNSVSRNVNEDCVNAASILITTVTPNLLNENFEVFTTPKLNLVDGSLEDISTTLLPNMSNENSEDSCVSAEVSMQDLQNLSDSMLQQEERQSTNVECSTPSDEAKVESLTKYIEDPNRLDSDSSASTPTETILEPENLDNMQRKTIKEPRLKLLDSNSIDKTILNIKSYILKKKENLNHIKTSIKNRNIPNQESEDNSVSRNVNEDCVNEGSILITTVTPNLLNENLEVFTTPKLNLVDGSLEDTSTTLLPNMSNENSEDSCVSAEVSMQDLQNLSDSMLQQEERQATNVECNTPSDEAKVESSTKNIEGPNRLDSDSSASTPTETILEPENLDNVQVKSEEINACKTDLPLQTDINAQASEIIINTIPKASEILDLQSTIKPTFGLLRNQVEDISDVLKLPPLDPLHAIDTVKDKFTKLLNKNERNTEDTFPSAVKFKSEYLDSLNPLRTTDINPYNFPLQKSLYKLSEGNFDNLEVPQKSSLLPNMPNLDTQSYKTESLLSKDLPFKPVNSKSTFKDTNGNEKYLKATNNLNDHVVPLNDLRDKLNDSSVEASNNIYSSLKNTQNAVESKLRELKNDPWNDLKDQLTDSSVEASKNIYSSLKNTQNAVESKIRQLKNNNMNILKTPIKSSLGLLDTLSQNHADMNNKLRNLHLDFNDKVESMRNDLMDSSKLLTSRYRSTKPSFKSPSIFHKEDYENINHKLRALHMDFNDRIESMRNDIIDGSNLLTGGSRGTKSSFRSSNNFNKQNKPNIPLKKTWQATNRREPKLFSTGKQTPLKISSTSKTLEQKKLRMPAAASVPVPRTVQVPALKATSAKLPPTLQKVTRLTPNTDTKVNADVSRNFGEQARNLQLPSTLRNKINLKKDNKIKVSFSTTPRPEMLNVPNFRSTMPSRRTSEDHNGSPSEIKNSKTSVFNYDQPNKYRYSSKEADDELFSKTSGLKEKGHLKVPKNALHSWPKATESAFLSKVKEAVRERLSNVNLAEALKQSSMQADKAKEMRQLSVLKSDMERSASENKEIVNGQTLQENVSYKCKMVCTKDLGV